MSELSSDFVFNSPAFHALLEIALEEDIGSGDITTLSIVSSERAGRARIYAKEKLVVCGHEAARRVIARLDPSAEYNIVSPDGVEVLAGQTIAEISGKYGALLSAERICLNFLQRLSGVATKTRKLVELLEGSDVRILDTRKTAPGHRLLDKYAVKVGGGDNHRMGLFDAVLIKDNHIEYLGGNIREAIRRARAKLAQGLKLEVEVRKISELADVLIEKPDAILLDNMSVEQVKEAINLVRQEAGKAIEVEVSGGVNENNLQQYAATGVDVISVGAITHSAKAVDIAIHTEPI